MPAALSADRIAEIKRLAGGGLSLAAIARQLKVSVSTVHKYAPPGSFDRAPMAAAVKAHQVDAAARRAAQRQRYLDIVDELQDRATASYDHAQPAGADGDVRRWSTERPPARETAELVKAASAATMAELRIADHDSDGALDEARSVLDGFMEAVARRVAELPE